MLRLLRHSIAVPNELALYRASSSAIVVLAAIEHGDLRAAIPKVGVCAIRSAGLRKLRPTLGSKNERLRSPQKAQLCNPCLRNELECTPELSHLSQERHRPLSRFSGLRGPIFSGRPGHWPHDRVRAQKHNLRREIGYGSHSWPIGGDT
jgi:hypothetical protein